VAVNMQQMLITADVQSALKQWVMLTVTHNFSSNRRSKGIDFLVTQGTCDERGAGAVNGDLEMGQSSLVW